MLMGLSSRYKRRGKVNYIISDSKKWIKTLCGKTESLINM